MVRTECAKNQKTHRPLARLKATPSPPACDRQNPIFCLRRLGTTLLFLANLFSLVILFPPAPLRDLEMPSMWLSENQSEFPFEHFWRLATVSHVLVAQYSRDYVGALTDVLCVEIGVVFCSAGMEFWSARFYLATVY